MTLPMKSSSFPFSPKLLWYILHIPSTHLIIKYILQAVFANEYISLMGVTLHFFRFSSFLPLQEVHSLSHTV